MFANTYLRRFPRRTFLDAEFSRSNKASLNEISAPTFNRDAVATTSTQFDAAPLSKLIIPVPRVFQVVDDSSSKYEFSSSVIDVSPTKEVNYFGDNSGFPFVLKPLFVVVRRLSMSEISKAAMGVANGVAVDEESGGGRRSSKRANRGTKRFYSPEEEERRQEAMSRRNSVSKQHYGDSSAASRNDDTVYFSSVALSGDQNSDSGVASDVVNISRPISVSKSSTNVRSFPLKIQMPKWHKLHNNNSEVGSSSSTPAKVSRGRKSTELSSDDDFVSDRKHKKRQQSPSPERIYSNIPRPPPMFVLPNKGVSNGGNGSSAPKVSKLVLNKQPSGDYSVDSPTKKSKPVTELDGSLQLSPHQISKARRVVAAVLVGDDHQGEAGVEEPSSILAASFGNGHTVEQQNAVLEAHESLEVKKPRIVTTISKAKIAAAMQQTQQMRHSSEEDTNSQQSDAEDEKPHVILKISSPNRHDTSKTTVISSVQSKKRGRPKKEKIAALVDDIKQVLQEQGALDEATLSDEFDSLSDGGGTSSSGSRGIISSANKFQNRNGLRAALIIPARSSRLRKQQEANEKQLSVQDNNNSLNNSSISNKPRIEPRPSEDATRSAVAALEMELAEPDYSSFGGEDSGGEEKEQEDDGIPVAVVEVVMSQNQVKLQEVTSPSRSSSAMEPIVINTIGPPLGYIDPMGMEVLREHSYCIPIVNPFDGSSPAVSPGNSTTQVITGSALVHRISPTTGNTVVLPRGTSLVGVGNNHRGTTSTTGNGSVVRVVRTQQPRTKVAVY